MPSPTARTLKKLAEDGWMAGLVERWIPRTRITKDLFGIGDILAVKGCDELLIQATSDEGGGHGHNRIAKIKAEPRAHEYLYPGSGRRIEVWAWRYLKRKDAWEPKITEITLDDLLPVSEGRER